MPAAARAAPHAAMLLPDDGLIDELAVSIAVSGARRVRLTPPERDLAARIMVARGADFAELAAHLGTSTAAAGRLVKALGYRLGPPCPRTKHRWIMPEAA
jgi:hypothetical protein